MFHEQIVALAQKLAVLFALKHEDNIARNRTRRLIRLALKHNLLLVLHTLINLNLQNLVRIELLM